MLIEMTNSVMETSPKVIQHSVCQSSELEEEEMKEASDHPGQRQWHLSRDREQKIVLHSLSLIHI
eukprot:8658048-Prorocentrum_lima.AAC.1